MSSSSSVLAKLKNESIKRNISNQQWNRFIEKEIKMIIEFDKVIDTILKFTLPICEAIENDEKFTKIWKYKEENYYTR